MSEGLMAWRSAMPKATPVSSRLFSWARGRRASSRSSKCGPDSPSTHASWRSTCQGSGTRSGGTTCSRRLQWASSSLTSSRSSDSGARTQSAPTSGRRRCCSPPRSILAFLRSIVVGNGTAAVPIQIGSVRKDVVEAPSLEAFRNVDPRKGVESVLAFVERYKLPDHVREDFLSSYEGDRFVESLRFVRSYPTELPLLAKLLPNIETPVQIITGDHDTGVLPGNGDYLHERLPHSKSDKIDANHFAWADAADQYGTLIIDWWNGGYQRV